MNMRKNEYGLATIKLIFTIIILIAIISGAVFLVSKQVESNHVTDIKTDLLYIQAMIKGIHDKKVVDANQSLLGEEISEYNENETINEMISGEEKWYKLSQDDLNQIGIGYLKAEEGFIVNYETEEVIYIKGVQEEEQTYYKLSDMIDDEQEEQKTENAEENSQE